LLAGRQNHGHLPSFHGWHLFDFGFFIHVGFNPQQNIKAQFLMRHFSAPEPQRDFHFVAFIDEFVHRAHFYIVVMLLNVRSELDFLDLNGLLLLSRFVFTLLRFVLIFAVIQNFCDRR